MSTPRQSLPYGFQISLNAEAKRSSFNSTEQKENAFNYTFYINPPKKRKWAFKGGGRRIFIYQKFVEIAQEMGLLASLDEVGGSSSGSLAAIFTAIHFENQATRALELEKVNSLDSKDIMGDSLGWNIYRVLSAPLFLISKPLQWSGQITGFIANQFNKVGVGKLIGIPLNLVASLAEGLGALLSPRGFAGTFNLFTAGGVYKGDVLQAGVREAIWRDTQDGLESILKNREISAEDRDAIERELVSIGLVEECKPLRITKEITFKHFNYLSKLPGSQFKEIFITGVRLRDKALVIFNSKNWPDMPVHIAARIAMSFPRVYKDVEYQGEIYIDGGAINNSPVALATAQTLSPFEKNSGITDNMKRLAIRVEYDDGLKNILWGKPEQISQLDKIKNTLKFAFYKGFAKGIDTFATDDVVTDDLRENYSHCTVQISDGGVGLFEDVGALQRAQHCENAGPGIKDYFANHHEEKVAIQDYQASELTLAMRVQLLNFLKTPTLKAEDIFYMPGKSQAELELLREQEIKRWEIHAPIKGLREVQTELQSKFAFGTAQILKKTLSVGGLKQQSVQQDVKEEKVMLNEEKSVVSVLIPPSNLDRPALRMV